MEVRHLFCPFLEPELINTHYRYRDIASILSLGNFRRLLLLSAVHGENVPVPVWDCPLTLTKPENVQMSCYLLEGCHLPEYDGERGGVRRVIP